MNKGEDGSTEVPSVRMKHTDVHNDERPSPTFLLLVVKCPSFTQKERSDVTLISYVTVAGQPTGDSAKVRFLCVNAVRKCPLLFRCFLMPLREERG